MKRTISALTVMLASGLAFSALAQPPAPPEGGAQPGQPPQGQPPQGQPPEGQPPQGQPPQAEPQPTVDVSDSDLDTFTTIYVEVREISEEYESRMASVEDAEEAQQLQSEMREESLGAIEEHGWTQQQYSETAQAINSDQELLEEAMAQIEEKS